ncbi:hypothetical protein [Ekhidna sp.]|uniref:hypothetical protein n=1 Tax=Ekhidna sp. TaxID=2608089 RepID=UPI0035113ED6
MKLISQVSLIIAIATACTNTTSESKNQTIAPPVARAERVFDYQPQSPVNGELNAVIELGSLGLNYFVVNIDNQGRWKLVKSEYGRTNIIYGATTTNQIIDKISDFKSTILKAGVKDKNIFAVASSTFVKTEDVNRLREQLSEKGIKLKTVDASLEGKYAMMATIPREFIKESYLVDIGSGNTKVSWIDKADTLSVETHGSKYFLNNTQDTTVFREVRNVVLNIPEKNRNLCFILGGAIYELVKDEVSEKNGRYYVLKHPSAYPKSNEKLNAGNVIYGAIYSEPTYSYIFDSQSNFSIGYLVSLKLEKY